MEVPDSAGCLVYIGRKTAVVVGSNVCYVENWFVLIAAAEDSAV